jgi:hypothetical protein
MRPVEEKHRRTNLLSTNEVGLIRSLECQLVTKLMLDDCGTQIVRCVHPL